MGKKAGFVVIWEFHVPRSQASRFEEAYGSNGPWARLFGTSPDFVGTDLQCDLSDPLRYWTLDYWTSESMYDEFRSTHAAEYKRIDTQCEELTAGERQLGRFRTVASCLGPGV